MKIKLANALSYVLPGFGDILWIGVFLGVIGLGPRMLNIDGDLGRHLTIGGLILNSGSIPTFDMFSHTMIGQPLTPHEWLAQAAFALAYRLMGLDGVVLECGLIIAGCFWLVYRSARAEAGSVLASVLVTVLAIAASSLHWLSRPHIFTFLLLALWMKTLEDLRRGKVNRWWLLPALMLVWANLHGAFIAGFVSWGIYGVGMAWDQFWKKLSLDKGLPANFWRYYFLGGAASALITLVNPSGIHLWETSIGYLGNRYLVSHTAEYLPPNFHDPSTWPFLLTIGLLVVLLGLREKRSETAHVLIVAAWLVMGLYSTRNIPLFAIVSTPFLARELTAWLEENFSKKKGLTNLLRLDERLLHTDLSLRGYLWPVAAILLVVFGYQSGARLDFQQQGNDFDPKVFPVQAVDWLIDHPQQGNMFNYFTWGGYILYRDWPAQRVFIDAQTDFYGESLTRQYEQVLSIDPAWESVIDQYHVRWVIIPSSEALTGKLREQNDWKLVYQDGTAVIFSRILDE